VRERQSLVLFWSCANRICGWLRQNSNIFSWLHQYGHQGFSTRFDYIVLDMVQSSVILEHPFKDGLLRITRGYQILTYRSMECSRSQARRLTIFKYIQKFSLSEFFNAILILNLIICEIQLQLNVFWRKLQLNVREAVKDKFKVGLRWVSFVVIQWTKICLFICKSIKKVLYLENARFVSVLIMFSILFMREKKRSPRSNCYSSYIL
jgi:hypothetical protein